MHYPNLKFKFIVYAVTCCFGGSLHDLDCFHMLRKLLLVFNDICLVVKLLYWV